MEPNLNGGSIVSSPSGVGGGSGSGSGGNGGNGGGSNGGGSSSGGWGWLPIGVILPYGANTENAPDGWLYCRGQELKIEEYQDLYNVIGFTYTPKEQQGLDTFNLPDLRGQFIRGFDTGAGLDSNREFGQEQAGAVPNITGGQNYVTGGQAGIGCHYNLPTGEIYMIGLNTNTGGGHNGIGTNASLVSPVYATATEVRPVNTALNYIIKF